MLLGCAFWFTYKTKFVQFRMIGEMVRLLGRFHRQDRRSRTSHLLFSGVLPLHSKPRGNRQSGRSSHRHYIGWSGCSLLDVGNCTFWCQQCLLSNSTLAQLYKVHGLNSFVGGPAYYMKKGLKQPWMGILFAFCSFSPSGLLSIPCRATLSVPHSRKLSIFLRL